ncbi:hypothetical protein O0880_14200 [Janthinobacterium sp. SUN118]|nr:hypothetical protein [Janthinobacterium sp. SUN118]MDN2710574.1 hypothetical protein [Janthinobacterium sp. SUN118]
MPLLATSPVTAILVWLPAPADWMLPLLLSQPFACSTRLPAVAANTPALRTPRPASVPTRVILPAYMPPSCATSSAYVAAGPTPDAAPATPCAASIWFVPVTTFNSCAQMPPLICAARARIAV